MLLKHPEFMTVVGYAKALAVANQQTQLTPLLILAGWVLARSAGALGAMPAGAAELEATITAAAERAQLPLNRTLQPLTELGLPLTAELKALLGQHLEGALDALLTALVATLPPSAPASPPAAAPNPLFQQFDRYAQAVASHYHEETLTPELFAVGAWVAYRRGELADKPAIAAHLAAYQEAIEAWLAERGWSGLEAVTALAEHPVMTAAPAYTQALANDHGKAADPVLSLLNAGITAVTKVLWQERVAFHEAGHAIATLVLRPEVRLAEVSIIEDRESNGRVAYDPTSPFYATPTTREDFIEDLCVALAGRVAQLKQFGREAADSGATNDLAQATARAWHCITEFGLDDDFGPVHLHTLGKEYGVRSGWLFDEAQRRLQSVLKEAHQATERLLADHWDQVEKLARGLVARQRLTEDEVHQVLAAANPQA